MIYFAYKIALPEEQMGYNFLLTISYFGAAVLTYSTMQSNVWLYITVNVKAARLPFAKMQTVFSRLRIAIALYTFVNFAVHAIPFFIFYFSERQDLLTQIYFTVKGLLVLGLSQAEKLVTLRLVAEIESVKLSGSNPHRDKLTTKLKTHATAVRKAGIVNMSIFMTFGFWPLLRTYGSYVFPIIGFLGTKPVREPYPKPTPIPSRPMVNSFPSGPTLPLHTTSGPPALVCFSLSIGRELHGVSSEPREGEGQVDALPKQNRILDWIVEEPGHRYRQVLRRRELRVW